ncbi:MAG: GNAT family N-acetyltransferase [Mesorhizobium sp.]
MIETERLILRPNILADFDALHALNSHPEAMRYIGTGQPATREDSWIRLLRNAGHWSLMGYGLFAVTLRETGTYIGHTGLADFHRGLGDDFDPYPEAGWAFMPAFHGKGYALEATQAALGRLQAERAPSRTVCIIDHENVPSLRLADKLGYRRYGEAQYKGRTAVKLERHAR